MKRKVEIGILVLVSCLMMGACTTTKLDGSGATGDAVADNSWIQEESLNQEQEQTTQEIDKDETKEQTAVDTSKQDTSKTKTDTKKKTESNKKESNKTEEKDQYQTTAVPAGKPDPVEPEDATVNQKVKLSCTVTISCATILDHMDELADNKKALIPEDGIIVASQKVTFYAGESVYDVLKRMTKENKIQMEATFTPVYNSAYIEGIDNLYEFDCGELSGWMFCVNDWYPNYGCARYSLEDGDVIEWNYTCDLGRDLGQEGVTQQ